MCQAVRELLKEEIEEEKQTAVDNALVTIIRNLVKETGWPANQAMEYLAIPEADQRRYASKLYRYETGFRNVRS